MRSIKEQVEIDEIEKAVGIAYEMHTTAMKMCKPGVKEQEISELSKHCIVAEADRISYYSEHQWTNFTIIIPIISCKGQDDGY